MVSEKLRLNEIGLNSSIDTKSPQCLEVYKKSLHWLSIYKFQLKKKTPIFFLFINICGPNTDALEFYCQLLEQMKVLILFNIIIGGDFNLVLDQVSDKWTIKNKK